jgi:hypothetical protein
MKRLIVGLTTLALLFISSSSVSFATELAGTKCTKAGAVKISNNKQFTCIKLGRNLYWNNGVKISTVKYRVGDRGPAGGTIFYVESSVKSWGQYLEFAPNGWFDGMSDPKSIWCDLTDREILQPKSPTDEVRFLTGNEIGKGKVNTQIMLNICNAGAANIASEYFGGGKSDWFLPSLEELNQLCKFARGQTQGIGNCKPSGSLKQGFSNHYWSSSEVDAKYAWDRFFNIGNSNLSNKDFDGNWVRPIRSF